MELNIKINDEEYVSPQIDGSGFLVAHIVLSNKKERNSPSIEITATGHDMNDSKNTKHLNWGRQTLKYGDKVVIHVGKTDDFKPSPPVKESKNDKSIIVSNYKVADKIIKTIMKCNNDLEELYKESKDNLSEEEFKNVAFTIGDLIYNNFEKALKPIFRQYPDKRPEEFKNGAL